jgi:hypothetical protein
MSAFWDEADGALEGSRSASDPERTFQDEAVSALLRAANALMVRFRYKADLRSVQQVITQLRAASAVSPPKSNSGPRNRWDKPPKHPGFFACTLFPRTRGTALPSLASPFRRRESIDQPNPLRRHSTDAYCPPTDHAGHQ